MKKKGNLYLFPSPLSEGAIHTLPSYVIEQLHQIEYFIAERAKTARHFIKATKPVKAFSELHFSELNKHTDASEIRNMLAPADEGHNMGLLSEAGCPGVADPGAAIVAQAHQKGIKVIPFVGPSSILLALMASGMNGQSFAFQGYLSPKKPNLARDLKRLEQQAIKQKQTQIFIETPYRNQQLMEIAFKTLSPNTKFCIAADITGPDEMIQTKKIGDWRKAPAPNLHKRPVIYLIYS